LARIGGRDLSQNTFRVMKSCIGYSLASTYSLLGQKTKKNFSSHPLYRVIMRTYTSLSLYHRLLLLHCYDSVCILKQTAD